MRGNMATFKRETTLYIACPAGPSVMCQLSGRVASAPLALIAVLRGGCGPPRRRVKHHIHVLFPPLKCTAPVQSFARAAPELRDTIRLPERHRRGAHDPAGPDQQLRHWPCFLF